MNGGSFFHFKITDYGVLICLKTRDFALIADFEVLKFRRNWRNRCFAAYITKI